MTAAIRDNTSAASPYQPDGVRHLGAKRALGRTLESSSASGTRFQRVMDTLGRKIDPADKQAVHGAATLLVSQLFIAPLLAQARELPFGGEVGDGGRAEEIFGEQLDQRLADLVAGNLPGLTSQIESKLSRDNVTVVTDMPRSVYASWPAELKREGAN